MIRSLPRRGGAFLAVAVAVAAFGVACHPGVDTPAVPLYPNGATKPLPRDQLAQVSGPIATIDGQQVVAQGGLFDLLPGCHFIELDRRPVGDSYALASGQYWIGEFPATIYALRMRAGARYVIRREMVAEGSTGRIAISAREEQPNGAVTDLFPATSAADIAACQQSGPITSSQPPPG